MNLFLFPVLIVIIHGPYFKTLILSRGYSAPIQLIILPCVVDDLIDKHSGVDEPHLTGCQTKRHIETHLYSVTFLGKNGEKPSVLSV